MFSLWDYSVKNPGFDNLPLEWVRAFEAAARCGSFTAAAAESGLTQPAVSQRISSLEQRLGVQLFIRGGRNISLTVDGEAWLPHVQTALSGLRESTEALFGSAPRRLVISASQSVAEHWIIPRLDQFRRKDTQVILRTMLVASDDGDARDTIRIRYGTGDWPDVYKTPLFDEVIAPVAAPALLANGQPWQHLPRIAVSGPRPGWDAWSRETGTPSTPLPALHFDTLSAGIVAARAGLGVLLASVPLCDRDLAQGALVQLTTTVLPNHRTYWLLAAKTRISQVRWKALSQALTATDNHKRMQ